MKSESWDEIAQRLKRPHEINVGQKRPDYVPFNKQGPQEIDLLIPALENSELLAKAHHLLSLFSIRFIYPEKETEIHLNPPGLGISGSETKYSIDMYLPSEDKILVSKKVPVSSANLVVNEVEKMFAIIIEDDEIQ